MGIFALIVLGIIVLVVLIGVTSAIRIINEYERGVLFRLGRLMALKGPGLRLIIPFGIDRLVKIDLRTVTLEVPDWPGQPRSQMVCAPPPGRRIPSRGPSGESSHRREGTASGGQAAWTQSTRSSALCSRPGWARPGSR